MEKANQTLMTSLARSTHDQPRNWSRKAEEVSDKHNMVKHNITELPPVVCFYVGLSEREDELFQLAPKKYHDIIKQWLLRFQGKSGPFASLRNFVLYGVKVSSP